MRDVNEVDNLIIGAGLSGLSVAYYLGDNYVILEKDKTPGGYCRTIPNDRYVWDYAGHFYHFRTEKYKKMFLELVEENQIIRQKKNTKIYYNNQLIDYPFQTNIHELDKKEFIECLYDLYFRESKDNYNNFLDMLYAKFGKAIVEKFLRPYNEKLYATDLKNLDKDAMGRFFPYADFKQVMESMGNQTKETYNDEFMYLKKGTGYFIEKLYKKLNSEKIRFGDGVTSIDLQNKIVTTMSGEKYYYKSLINTIPLNEFLRLVGSNLADELSYNKVLVLNLGFDKPSPKYNKEHWIYFPDKSLNFYRIGFYNNILLEKKLSVYVEIGFPKSAKEVDVERELAMALDGMKKVGIIDETMSLVDKNIILMDPAYVHISTSEKQKVDAKMKELEKKDAYMLGRYGCWTYNCMEDCIGLADKLAEKIKNG